MECPQCGLRVPSSQTVTTDGLNYRTISHPYRLMTKWGSKVLCSRTCLMQASIANALESEHELQLELPLEMKDKTDAAVPVLGRDDAGLAVFLERRDR